MKQFAIVANNVKACTKGFRVQKNLVLKKWYKYEQKTVVVN